ncbi:hypothetical protein OB03_13080 [Brevundimonas sp. GN22]
MSNEFILRFDGADASRHAIDMGLLGKSLVGVDQAIHKGLWACHHPTEKLGRKRTDIRVQVAAPRAACVEVSGFIAGAMGVLPFVYEVSVSLGSDYVKHLLSSVVLYHGGRKQDASQHMEKLLEIFQEAQRSSFNDRSEERATMERMHARSLSAVQDAIETMLPQAKQIVAPVGRTSEVLLIGGGDMRTATEIDVAIADAVRSGGSITVGDMEQFHVKFDSLTRHSRNAKVELVEDPGRFIAADIRDPAFDEFPNVYSAAFNEALPLNVQAKPSFKDDVLVKLHILNAEPTKET